MRKWIFLFWMAMFIAGCDLIEYHPYDVRLSGKLDINKKMISGYATCIGSMLNIDGGLLIR